MSTMHGSANGGRQTGRSTSEAAAGKPSVGELIGRLGDDVTVLFRQEVELAKLELKQEMTQLGKAGAMLIGGAILALTTLLLLAWTVAWALSELLPTWLAFLITAILFGIAATAVATAGKRRLDDLDLTPRTTIETLQQDKQMLTDRMTS